MKRAIYCVVLCFISCSEEEITARNYPRVITREVTNIASGMVTFNGEITYASVSVLDHGFVYSNVDFGDFLNITNGNKKSLGVKSGIGKFEFKVDQGLIAGKKYYIKAYAISKDYIVYGNVFEFVSK